MSDDWCQTGGATVQSEGVSLKESTRYRLLLTKCVRLLLTGGVKELSEWVSYDSDKRKCETQTSVTWSINSAALSAIQSALTHEMVTRECAIMFHNVTNILTSPSSPSIPVLGSTYLLLSAL